MKRFLLCCLLCSSFLAASASLADDKFDPAARAKVIAPFIDEQTIAVIHVDLSRFKLDAWYDKMVSLVPELKEDILHEKNRDTPQMDAFVKAGGKDIYGVFQAPTFMGATYRFVVIPVGPGVDERAITENEMFKGTTFKRSGDLLVGGMVGGPGNSGVPDLLSRLEKNASEKRPELAVAFEAAGDTGAQAFFFPPKVFKRVIEESMPQLPKEIGGGPSSVVTQGCLWAALGVDVAPNLKARLVIQSQDAVAAAALSKKLAEVLQKVAQLPVVKEAVPKMSEAIDVLTPKAEGDRLKLVIDEKQKDTGILFDAVLTPILNRAIINALRMASINNMKQFGLAMHNYHDAYRHFPAAASYSKDGKPLLSWRVMILPMLEEGVLYDQFHFDEPWDSEHNKDLIDKMPAIYRSPKSKLKEPGKTNYVVPVGPGTVFEGREGTPIKNITDGTAHTFMAVEVDDAHAVIWTKPDDLPYDPKEPSKGLGGLYKNVFIALNCDGSVRVIELPCPDEKLRAAFSAAAGDPAPDFD